MQMYEDLYLYNTQGVTMPSKIVLSGISYCDANYLINRPNSRFSTLEYVISGSGTIILDGKKYTAYAGDAYYLPCNKDQYYYSDAENPWQKMFFNATGNITNLIAGDLMLLDTVVFHGCDISERMRQLLDIKNQSLSPVEMQRKSLLLMHEIFLEIYEKTRTDTMLPQDRKELKALKDFMDINITRNITLDELALHIFRSKNYVIKLFREYCNQTPYEYFLNKKMELSKKLLEDTTLPIWRIAEYLNFETSNYFSSSFRRRFGISPLTYRKQHTEL